MIYHSISNLDKRVTLLAAFLFLLSACSSKPIQFPESQTNYCADITSNNGPMLGEYLKPVENKMVAQTGVYVLEQGIEAMLSRA